jgi:uncharacterized membrane protein
VALVRATCPQALERNVTEPVPAAGASRRERRIGWFRMDAVGWLILVVVVVVLAVVAFMVIRRRRRGGGVIATKEKR